MARNENPPIERGTYDTTGAFDHLLGKEWVFEDLDLNQQGAKPNRTGRDVTVRYVKNVAGFAVLPKRCVRFQTANGPNYGCVVDGYNAIDYERSFPVDEFVVAAGVPDQARFYIVVRGPALCKLPLAGASFNGTVAEGQVLVALTAVTSGATTAGRLACQNITGSTQTSDYTFILNQAENYIGRALSAKTTGNTDSDILVEVGHW